MSLRSLQKDWDRLGAADPFWAILTEAPKANGAWNRDEFFARGVAEVRHVLHLVESRVALQRGQALDFGCGVGRLTQALAEEFEHACGVDISASMLKLAQQYNKHPERCEYVLNTAPDLAAFASGRFDFVYSNITLQHVEPRYVRRYLPELLRVLKPGGVLAFQLPARFVGRNPIYRYPHLRRGLMGLLRMYSRYRPVIQMYAIPRREVVGLLEASQGAIADILPSDSAGAFWESFLYVVVRE